MQRLRTTYTLHHPQGDMTFYRRGDVARWRFVTKAPVTITFETVDMGDVEMCYGCKARPALWEMDCDGPYATASCEECDWWACVEAREKSSRAGCAGSNPKHHLYGDKHNC